MKPKCKICERKYGLSLDDKLTKEILNNLLDAKSLSEKMGQRTNFDEYIESLFKKYTPGESEEEKSEKLKSSLDTLLKSLLVTPVNFGVIFRYKDITPIISKVWEDLQKSGKAKEIPVSSLIRYFLPQVIKSLAAKRLIELHSPNRFTEKGALLMAEKLLEETFSRLEKRGYGVHELLEQGPVGDYPSSVLRHYDDFRDTFDMIDLNEALIAAAIRDPKNMQFKEEDLQVRLPYYKTKSANILLIDKSKSMERGKKIIGAVKAALSLKALLRNYFTEDSLWIVAYDEKPRLLSDSEVANLYPYGRTDIGRAIDYARKILAEREKWVNKNVFLITDSEPTVSCSGADPVQNAINAAYEAGLEDIRLNIIMLDNSKKLIELCKAMARANKNSTVTYVRDPESLAEFVIKSYVEYKQYLYQGS